MMFSFAQEIAKERTDELMRYAADTSESGYAERHIGELNEIMDDFGNFDYSVIANIHKFS